MAEKAELVAPVEKGGKVETVGDGSDCWELMRECREHKEDRAGRECNEG